MNRPQGFDLVIGEGLVEEEETRHLPKEGMRTAYCIFPIDFAIGSNTTESKGLILLYYCENAENKYIFIKTIQTREM